MRYEVRTEFTRDDTTVTCVVETTRSWRADAEQDVQLLKFLGKRAWIVEVAE